MDQRASELSTKEEAAWKTQREAERSIAKAKAITPRPLPGDPASREAALQDEIDKCMVSSATMGQVVPDLTEHFTEHIKMLHMPSADAKHCADEVHA